MDFKAIQLDDITWRVTIENIPEDLALGHWHRWGSWGGTSKGNPRQSP